MSCTPAGVQPWTTCVSASGRTAPASREEQAMTARADGSPTSAGGRRAAQRDGTTGTGTAGLTAAVTIRLAETLDAREAVGRLARLVVPALGDWCVVTLVEDDECRAPHRRPRDIGWWHRDEQSRPLVERYAACRLSAVPDGPLVSRLLDHGHAITSCATDAIRGMLGPGEARDLIGILAPESVAIVPLRGRGRTLGAITVFNGPERGRLVRQDLAALREVAAHAGLALDNARLYRRQLEVAEAFQRSVLAEPVSPRNLEIAARYRPAAEAAKVGGDWYDAFPQPDGSTVLVIGDVVGHDLAAAAVMAQTRSILRGVAVVTGDGPAALLRHVDRAMHTLRLDTMATVVAARVEQSSRERAEGVATLRWSSAGHPAPLLLEPDGTVRSLDGTGPGLLLGVQPETIRSDAELVLRAEQTVLMYTDGLVERRDRSLSAGMEHLRETLSDVGGLALDDVCDAVLDRMLPGQPDDDVALVALRLRPAVA